MDIDPNQQLAEDISSLQGRINDAQQNVRLTDTRGAVEELHTAVAGLPQQVANLRTRGYVFEKDMETQAAGYAQQWATLYPSLTSQLDNQAANMEAYLHPLEAQMNQLNGYANSPIAAQPLVNSLKASLNTLESRITAAQNAIEAMYNPFSGQVAPFIQHLKDIDWMLTQLAEAKFQLLPSEGGIAAVKAIWCKSGKESKDDPAGVLYLTDQRVLFEQKQEIATKKVLFVATAKQLVQNLLFEAPVALASNVQTSKQGLFKNEDHIEIHFAAGAPAAMAHFHVWQDCSTWLQLVNRAKSKDFDTGRAVAVSQAEVEKVKAAPAQCPSCGATLNQVVLRGMDSIKCEYCGFVIRL